MRTALHPKFLPPFKSRSLNNNLIHYWALEEDSPNDRLDSVGSWTLTQVGTPSKVAAKHNFGLLTVGVSSDAVVKPAVVLPDIFTLSLWIRITAATAGTSAAYCFNGSSITSQFGINPAGTGYVTYVGDGTNYAFMNSGGSNPSIDLAWHLVIIWQNWADGTHRPHIQYDDVAADSGGGGETAPLTAFYRTAAQLYIGGTAVVGFRAVQGIRDEVAIWDRILTADERATLYNLGAGKFYPF